MNLELLVDTAHVEVDRVDRNTQFDCGCFIDMTFDEKLQQARFVWRELIVSAIRRTDFAKKRNYPASNFRRHRRTAAHCFFEALKQLRRRCFLEQVTGGSGA